MNWLFGSSIGRKLIMSVTGLFMMTFLLVHLTVNLMLLFGDGTLFNLGAHFMANNPVIRVIEPILAVGFIVHILYASIITLLNQRARPIGYNKKEGNPFNSWASKNMYILGGTILIFLVIHLTNFFWKIKFGDLSTVTIQGKEIEDAYSLVSGLFINYWWYDLLYIMGAVLLGLHLSHGFWSSFQTLGWNNKIWINRLEVIAIVYALIIGTGFAIIPLFFLLFK